MAARIRTVKPEFFLHDGLFEAEQESGLPLRLAYIGLWTQCDREGRFAWKPRALGIQILPYDGIAFESILDALVASGFLLKYTVNGEDFGCVLSFAKHQCINNRESDSKLPPPSLQAGASNIFPISESSPQSVDAVRSTFESGRIDAGSFSRPHDAHASRPCTSGTGMGTGKEYGTGDSPVAPVGKPPQLVNDVRMEQTPTSELASTIVESWNAIPGISSISKLTDQRKRALRDRLNDPYFRGNWSAALEIVARSEFCRGLISPGDHRKEPWRADFDWFLRAETLVKLMEGKYGGLATPCGSESSNRAQSLGAGGRFNFSPPTLTTKESLDATAFDNWYHRQDAFARNEDIRHQLHAMRCCVSRLLGHKPEVARDQLQLRIQGLAAGRVQGERPRRDDELQAARELRELKANSSGLDSAPADDSLPLVAAGGAA